ncbi:LysE family translocator [Aminobacter anthyllidis]|uniref:LysE family translocator n=1 Tax=Aminobacter anthyllidis TaxID=1035067 RepID=A0A9X1D394_9HYPH|nr:LysE family translocator [Aminobacter anthyllidis]MBT1155565.1 LysE family translocator [Aminobacter anthyllidis]
MPIDLFLSFALASALLILMPGPMVALIVSNSTAFGPRAGLTTVAGAASGMLLHLTAVCLGLGVALAGLGEAAFWLKWLGASYLLYLGLAALAARTPFSVSSAVASKSSRRLYFEAFAVQFTNPKVLMFYAAFFPVFMSPGYPAATQLVILSATFLAIEIAIDSMWALAAARARGLLASGGHWTNRVVGIVLIAAAFGTAAMSQS